VVEYLAAPRVLLTGRSMVESARWHEGRLWFADWGTGEVVALDLDGHAEVVARGPLPAGRMGWSIAWLPDGRLVTTGDEITRHEPDGTRTTLSDQGANEIVIDAHGRVYVDGADFDFAGGAAPEPGWIRLVEADGTTRQVAGDIDFPNGMLLTADGATLVIAESFAGRLSAFDVAGDASLHGRRVWADGLGPDGICVDADGAIWAQSGDTFAHTGDPDAPGGAVVRVLDGGEVTHRVETELPCFSCALGGPEGRHLFLLCNEFEGIDRFAEVQARRSSVVLVVEVPPAR
jgi:sugar lactone lactonase YvrE